MEILCIVEENKNIFSYHTSYILLSTLLNNLKDKVNYYLIVEHNGIKYSCDFRPLIKKYIKSFNITWMQLTSMLQVNVLLDYKKYSPKPYKIWKNINNKILDINPPEETNKIYRTETYIKTYSFDNDLDIEADFGSINAPDIRNVINLKSMLRDVIIRKNKSSINLSTTIPVINGVTFCPVYYSLKDELYIRESTKYLPVENNKNIVLLDFSPIGNIQTVRLSECTKKEPYKNNKLEIIFPSNINFENKSIILVIAGRLFFQKEINITSQRSIEFDIDINLHPILISNRIYKKDYDNPFTVTTSQLEYYFNEEVWKDSNYNNFVIIIDNPNVKDYDIDLRDSTYSISKKAMNKINNDKDAYRDIIHVPSDMDLKGILIRNVNRDITDYSYDHKISRDVIVTSPCKNIVITDTDLGYIENTSIKTYGSKISDSSFILKNICSCD